MTVSYTHLDVYKRQQAYYDSRERLGFPMLGRDKAAGEEMCIRDSFRRPGQIHGLPPLMGI